MMKNQTITSAESGRLGGLKRQQQMTKEQRTELGRKAAAARWAKRTEIKQP